MSGYDERKRGMDSKLSHDSELKFKVTNRRNRLLGLWAGGEMGLSGQALDSYAVSVIKSDFEQPGDDDVFRKVMGDLQEHGVAVDATELRRKMAELLFEAERQVQVEA